MNDEIDALTQQYQILEEEAQRYTGEKRTELFKAAARVKQQIVNKLNETKAPNKSESKVPGLDYFDNKLDDAFGDYFSGDYLTDDMRDYFTIHVPENAPEARQSTETPKSYEMDTDVRKRILNAIGIPC
ncbi:hypothetical protein D6C44_002733 [Escherichia coli]|nr:hypothetical protein [Escherichia coli]EEY1458585.1 hypothetical protein [Escherichia coli]EJV3641338.1 hypothetical protein [Escherichia coli]EJV3685649.1 hypothetical protein [Escherichia coli]